MIKSIESQLLLLWIMIIMITSTVSGGGTEFLINCGLARSATVNVDGRTWRSDDNPNFSPTKINTAFTAAVATGGGGDGAPYTTARIFNSTLTYTFPIVSPGPKFLRLYFSSSNTSYNNIPSFQFSVSLKANNLTLLRNFRPYLNPPTPSCVPQISNPVYEFLLTLDSSMKTKTLNLSFSPGNCSTGSCFGFINGIEIVSVPDGLYINNSKPYPYVNSPDYYWTQNTSASQTAYRLNVGGYDVQRGQDAGNMSREWYKDNDCIVGGFTGQTTYPGTFGEEPSGIIYSKIRAYTAPKTVYGTQRFIGLDDNPEERERKNLTWGFEVDVGFDYLVRLHFCEMDLQVNRSGERTFHVYLNQKRVSEHVDVLYLSEIRGSPVYQDYVVQVYGVNGAGEVDATKAPLVLALLPDKESVVKDVLLNGIEILKLSSSDGNLAVDSPTPPLGSTPQNTSSSSQSRPFAIIGSIVGGAALVFLAMVACLIIHRRAKNKASMTQASDVISSLPSELCQRFSLAQIRSATSDFDEAAIIGKGGFGKVYKGSIDIGGGSTYVAIKRLNPTSRQGVYEFCTEIEMLSRLRHLHLVSLIGYCEEQGEMILVYEYMPRGSLRDHLITSKKSSNNMNVDPLPWKQRLMICLGASRGLHYLHTCAKQAIIHRDVKSSNILLDEKWTAKVSDFGLSRVGPASDMGISHVSTMVKGSFGYLDPEYFRLQQLTEKSDVYSFGVVLFQVLCARAVVDPSLPRNQVNLALWARSHYRSGTLDSIIDPNLKGQIAAECLSKFGEIAEMCVRNERSERPSMGDVVGRLEFALQLQLTAEKNNSMNGTCPIQGLMDFSSSRIIHGSETEDELSAISGEKLSLSAITTTSTGKSEKHSHPLLR